MDDPLKPPFVDTQTATKSTYRKAIWDHLEKNNLADFPRPVHHRIPNFKGSSLACENCSTLDCYKNAPIVKVNPDKPQEQIRFLALQDQKCLLVPTPQLEHGLFNRIVPPADNADQKILRRCASSEGVRNFSVPISLNETGQYKVPIIIIGSTAVSLQGLRLGKGEGYAELEYGMLRSMRAVDDSTVIVTTVHDCQVFDELSEQIFDFRHDLTVDYICTPTRIIRCTGSYGKPKGIVWNLLTQSQVDRMPILQEMRKMEQEKGIDVTLKA